MGIPKFFRYISERYPLTSQLIQENKIPEFDNLYLDFNGIIHNCSHPNDEDAHFRLSEEQIFTSIFTYVDHLFGKIKPKKLFFMAVDGVAPRAKMNQQRSRRFRTAREAREIRARAEANGEKLPDEKAFDSNCITPGTPFMARLSEQLRYFINKKITEDSNWRDIKVIFSGHDVPGEGEHKIMEYIRLSRAQPDYNPNVRHCLYGLDADLIMLGLLSHDPHFCLLREEVKFGPARRKNNTSLEAINFYLLHLSLMREYLNLEFHDIESILPFGYNLERVIDDFILLAVFVGNDFLPHLPDLHIHKNGLERLFEVYKRVLPSMDGYINESGVINTRRLQLVINEMAEWEQEVFEKETSDMNWFRGKQAKSVKEMQQKKKQPGLVMTKYQREIFDKLKSFVLENRDASTASHCQSAKLSLPNVFPARDRAFIAKLSEDLHLTVTWDEYDDQDQNLVTWRFPKALSDRDDGENGEIEDEDENDSAWEDAEDAEDDVEARVAVDRVLKKYEKAPVADAEGSFDERHERTIKEKMNEWKGDYYRDKLEISYNNSKAMGDLIYRYVEGLQWVMHYYYSGVASWGWFYNYHYAPRISDLKGVDQMSFSFDLGKPFKPFEQLMGVLPVASMEHIPLAYQDLMYDVNSPILDFYPLEFEQDLNGKKQDWEAVVKIPFIDEKRLLEAMAGREHRLSKEEKERNARGTSLKFRYNPDEVTYYPSSLPGFFPPLYRCACVMEPFDLPTLDGLHLIPGLCDGVAEALPGFPSLKTLPHTTTLGYHGVNVHGSESRNQSMVVHIQNPYEDEKVEDIAKKMIGERIFMGWPFLQEGQVVALSDSLFKYEKIVVTPGRPARVVSNPHAPHGLSHWNMKAERIETYYSKRCGVITGTIDVLLHIRPLKGLKRLESGAFVKDYEGPDQELEQAVQMCLLEVVCEDPRFMERPAPPLSEEFPDGTRVFFLGEHAYGVAAQVEGTTESTLSVILAFYPEEKAEVDQFKSLVNNRKSGRYYPSYKAADLLHISGRALGKITSSFMIITSDGQKNNVGLSLKFEAKSMKVIDYSKKDGRTWEYSQKALDLISEYKKEFPELFRIVERSGDEMIKAAEAFPVPDPDGRVKAIRHWLKSKGVRDFEPVSLFCDQLAQVTVMEIEELADTFTKNKSASQIKKAIVKGIPRQAVLKPAHAIYRLQNQHFALGDRVTMIQDSGGVPLSVKGVVIGLNSKSMDVVWDVPFMAGGTLGDRCSLYRGSTVEFNTCLNLTNPQFVTPTNPKLPPPARNTVPFHPRSGPYPEIQPPPGQQGASGFRPAPKPSQQPQVHIMTNPNRGRGYVNGPSVPTHLHGEQPSDLQPTVVKNSRSEAAQSSNSKSLWNGTANGVHSAHGSPSARPPTRGVRGFSPPSFRGNRGSASRGRGSPSPRGFRGRGRGSFAPPQPS